MDVVDSAWRKRLSRTVYPHAAAHLTIDRVQCDVDAQTQPDQTGFFVCKQRDVDANGKQGMHWMEADAATTCIVDRIC